MKVWDGLCPGRKELQHTSAPKHAEYVAIVRQIQEIQAYIISTVTNVEVMPDLQQMLDDAGARVAEVSETINSLTPPKDLVDLVNNLDSQIKTMDCRGSVRELKAQLILQSRAVQSATMEKDAAVSKFSQDLAALDNKYRNALAQAEASHEQQMQEVKAELDRLNHLLTIKDAFSKV